MKDVDSVVSQLKSVVNQFSACSLALFLVNEHPQTSALILSYADPKLRNDVIKLMYSKTQYEVIVRLADLEATSTLFLSLITATLEKEVEASKDHSGQESGGIALVVEVLKSLDPKSESNILDMMRKESPELLKVVDSFKNI